MARRRRKRPLPRADIGSWELDSWELSRVPMRRLRSEMRLNARSVHQMQPTAATTPPIAPPTSDAGDTCSVSAVVPTTSTHHDRSPYIISHMASAPPMPSTLPATTAKIPCREQSAHLRRTEADRRSRPTSHALFDSKLEEQRHEQQRRDDDEEAEVDEVLPKSVAPREASRP